MRNYRGRNLQFQNSKISNVSFSGYTVYSDAYLAVYFDAYLTVYSDAYLAVYSDANLTVYYILMRMMMHILRILYLLWKSSLRSV